MTLTAYAQRRKVSTKAVSKAVATGRLSKSIARDKHGRPRVIDADLADQEWETKTRAQIGRPAAPPRAEIAEPRHVVPVRVAAAPSELDVPDYNVSRALREAAAARREAALADMAEIEVAELRGELVNVAEARADVIAKFTVVKTKILGIPARLAQRLPELAAEVVPVADELLREALEELAAEADGDAEEDEAA